MVCSHMREAGNEGIAATLILLQAYCWWKCMVVHVKEFVLRCLHCVDSRAGALVPRLYGETINSLVPNDVVHCDFLYVGDSGRAGPTGLVEASKFR